MEHYREKKRYKELIEEELTATGFWIGKSLSCSQKEQIAKFNNLEERFVENSPLQSIAAHEDDVPLFKKISEILGYINIEGQNNDTPLHMAAFKGNFNIFKWIIERLNDKNPENSDGLTPFHYAASAGHWKICKLIMGKILDKNPSNSKVSSSRCC